MYLITILAFAVLLWNRERGSGGRWLMIEDGYLTLLFAVGLPLVLAVATGGLGWVTLRRRLEPDDAHAFLARTTGVLRGLLLGLFALLVAFTPWPRWLDVTVFSPWLQVFADAIIILPFASGLVAIWIVSYPFERVLHQRLLPPGFDTPTDGSALVTESWWSFGDYLDFHVRHYLLVAAAPMLLILMGANLLTAYEEQVRAWTRGWPWAGDVALGALAAGVFLIAPALLTRLWRTRPLEAGGLRSSLEEHCHRMRLRFRDILVWQSGGVLINAAVMGLVGRLRYVLLSDGLLSSLTTAQVEAVFGHEVGHVRHRHIPYFLGYAVVGWLGISAVLEAVARILWPVGEPNPVLLQAEGLAAALAGGLWLLGFGWLSRRFERQADIFGAWSVSPEPQDCRLPCAVHPDGRTVRPAGRICMTGARIFADSLDAVATLNGIPHDERSWRHASIGQRISALLAMAGDPRRSRRFERQMRLVKVGLVIAIVLLGSGWLIYLSEAGEPLILRMSW